MAIKILRVDASARSEGSVTRGLNDRIIDDLASEGPVEVVTRDLADALPQIDETWVGANFTQIDARSDAQIEALGLSNALVEELRAADVIVIGMPVYNFGVPAALKAWIDQVARVGETFRYTENGPQGLLTGKRAVVSFASGGTPLGSDYDFASSYLRFVLGFIGISDVAFKTVDDFETAQAA